MRSHLGKKLTTINVAVVIFIIFIGGISIFLTKNILYRAYSIEEESEHIAIIDDIHTDAYRLVNAMHHFIIEADKTYALEVLALINKIETKITKYKAMELSETYEEKNLEIAHIDIILEDLHVLKKVTLLFEDFFKTGIIDNTVLIEAEEFSYEMEESTIKINTIHFNKIAEWTKESLLNMWIISIIYILFIIFGGIAIYLKHRILMKKVINPIIELSAATIEFSEGTFDKRVHTNSMTEIGQLYTSFNKMAEKLQYHDKLLRKFNEELEVKVKERTLAFEQANERLLKTQEVLIRTEKIAAVGQIAAVVAHEVKNPLNSLSISAQILIKELADKFRQDSSAYESATLILHEINRINNILEEFVKFSKFTEPQLHTNSINSVISKVVSLISYSIQDKDMKIELSLQDDIPEFEFDAGQFEEVLINLMQNAIRFINTDGKLEIKTATSAENIIITIKDNGEGIPEKYIDKIFTPFFSTDKKGLGLGLSIVQRIIESHGGTIKCTSTVGKGTVFEISLPIKRG